MDREAMRLTVRRCLGINDAADAPDVDAHIAVLLDEGWVAPLTIAKMVADRIGVMFIR